MPGSGSSPCNPSMCIQNEPTRARHCAIGHVLGAGNQQRPSCCSSMSISIGTFPFTVRCAQGAADILAV